MRERAGLEPCAIAYTAAIGACRKAGHRQGARALAAEMQRKGLGRSSAPEPAGV